MGALALPLLAALIPLATVGADAGVRVEGRATSVSRPTQPDVTRAAYSAAPWLTVLGDLGDLRVAGMYAPYFWTSSAPDQPTPYVNHHAEASLRLSREPDRRFTLSAAGTRGRTDPLEPTRATPSTEVLTSHSMPYEELQGTARGEGALDERTAMTAAASYQLSRAVDRADMASLPTQRTVSAEATVSRELTERDRLGVAASALRTGTDATGGALQAVVTSASLVWTRRTSTTVQLRAGAGGAFTVLSGAGPRRDTVGPAAEAGLAWSRPDLGASLEVGARLTTLVDRFSGSVARFAEGSLNGRRDFNSRLALTASAAGGSALDGSQRRGRAEVRLAWAAREALSLEAGVRARLQRDRRAYAPSFDEMVAFVGLSFRPVRLEDATVR